AEDGIRDRNVTGVQTCALPIWRLFKEICERLSRASRRLLGVARSLAELDTVASLAEAAALGGYVRPEMSAEKVLKIRAGRHPVRSEERRVGAECESRVGEGVEQ